MKVSVFVGLAFDSADPLGVSRGQLPLALGHIAAARQHTLCAIGAPLGLALIAPVQVGFRIKATPAGCA